MLSIKDLHVSVEDKAILRGLSLDVHPGEVHAIMGPNGSGKSTLVDLLPRFYDVNKGNIRIDDTDIREATLFDLRGLLGNVNQ